MTIPASPAESPPPPSMGFSSPPEPALAGGSRGRRRQMPLYVWAAVTLALLLLYNLVFAPSFFDISLANGRLTGNIINVLKFSSTVMLIALGMTLVIATGGIDLSVGAIMAIAGGLSALLLSDKNVLTTLPQVPAPLWVGLAVGLGAALLAGVWNGALIGYLDIQPIIATLILMISGRGLAIYLTHGQGPPINNDSSFLKIDQGVILGMPLPIIIVAIMAVLTILVVRRTALGMFFESIGNNSATCKVAGINTRFFKLLAYGFTGFCCGMAGIVEASMNRIGDTNNLGLDVELDVIVAVAIGGTSLVGGRFSLLGSLLGALAMQTLKVTIQSSGVKPEYNYVVKAFVVIVICLIQSPKFRALLARVRR